MRIVSHKKLKDFFETPGREDARVPLERWYEILILLIILGISVMFLIFMAINIDWLS